jgi:hypothetical protein
MHLISKLDFLETFIKGKKMGHDFVMRILRLDDEGRLPKCPNFCDIIYGRFLIYLSLFKHKCNLNGVLFIKMC